jgi:hypothetical protein
VVSAIALRRAVLVAAKIRKGARMKFVIIFAAIFIIWQAISKRLPVRSQSEYVKAAEKWSTGLPLAIIGVLDMISLFGLLILVVVSFFAMPAYKAGIFCVVLLALWMLQGVKGARAMRRAMKGSK